MTPHISETAPPNKERGREREENKERREREGEEARWIGTEEQRHMDIKAETWTRTESMLARRQQRCSFMLIYEYLQIHKPLHTQVHREMRELTSTIALNDTHTRKHYSSK
jgi:hypothetical protein